MAGVQNLYTRYSLSMSDFEMELFCSRLVMGPEIL